MKKSILRGTLLITIFSLIAKAIGMLFRIPVTHIIGEYAMGIYYYPLVLFGPILAFINAPSIAIARLISEEHSKEKSNNTEKILHVSTRLMIIIGVLTSLVMIILGPILISTIWSKQILIPYLALVPAPICLAMISVLKGYYQGHQNMLPLSIQQFTDAVARVIVGVSLSYLLININVIYATAGATFGTTAGAIVSLIFLYGYHRRHHKKINVDIMKSERVSITKKLMIISTPIAISALGVSLMRLVDGLFINNRLLHIGYSVEDVLKLSGALTSVNTLVAIPLVIATSISINALPNIITAAVHGEKYVQSRIRTTLIMFVTIALPSGVGLFLVGSRIFKIIFSNISNSYYLVELFSIALILMMLNLGLTSVLQARKKETIPVKNMYIGIIIKLVLSFILLGIPSIHIHGTALSTIIAYAFIVALNLKACLNDGVVIDFKYMLVVPIVATTLMGIVVQYTLTRSTSIFITGLSIILGVIVYGISMIVFKVIAVKNIPILKRFF